MAHDSNHLRPELLARLRQRLAERIGADRYAVWFGSQARFELGDDALCVAVPDRFSAERLRKTFHGDLEVVARELAGEGIRVEFIVDESLRRLTQRELPVVSEKAAQDDNAALHTPPAAAEPASSAPGRRFARLDEFIVGEENRSAYLAACGAPARLGAVSPLFLHGPTGSGKTHLLEGVWSAVRRSAPRTRCVYLSAEQFTSYFLEALQGSGLPSFRRKYREVQLLAIDDVQFFAGKRATLVELLHTIDTLHRAGAQLLLAADRPPAELAALGPELEARMSAGLVCQLTPPQRDTRRAILQRLAQQRGLPLPGDVLDLLAARLPGDARRLAGALNRLEAASQAHGRGTGIAACQDWRQNGRQERAPHEAVINVPLAEQALADLFQAAQRPVDLREIEKAVCEVFGVESPELHSSRKTKTLAQPRMLAMWLARKHTRAALQDISHYFGRRSHSTVISAEKAVSNWIEDGATIYLPHGVCHVQEAIRRVEARLGAG
jgi:chromosomal replication initiator protein